MKIKTKQYLIWITMLSLIFMILFWIGKEMLREEVWEYRLWTDVLGKVNTFWIFPGLLIFQGILKLFKEEGIRESIILKVIVVICTIFLGGIWCFLSFYGILLSIEDENRMSSQTLLVDKSGFLQETYFTSYEPVFLFFRRPSETTDEDRIIYLKEKYEIDFSRNEEDGKWLVALKYPDINVEVWKTGGKFEDDFLEKLTGKYLLEAYEKEGISREYEIYNNRFSLLYEGEDDREAFCQDASKLMQYVMQDKLLRRFRTGMGVVSGTGENALRFFLPLGKLQDWDRTRNREYYKDPEQILEIIKTEERLWNIIHGEAWKILAEDPIEDKNTEIEETILEETAVSYADYELELFECASAVYDAVYTGEELPYQESYNAKGNLYLDLGDGKTVVYDRESKNGKCHLFVAYQEKEGNTAILNFYAVNKETKVVTPGNKTAWAEVGSPEYREETGE